MHVEEINRDMERIKSQRKKKNSSSKEAYKRDKLKYFEQYKDILPEPQQQEHSIENDQNNIESKNDETNIIPPTPPHHTNNSPSKNEVHRYPKRKKNSQQS